MNRFLIPPRALFLSLLSVATLSLAFANCCDAAEGVSKGYPEDYQRIMMEVVRAFMDRNFKTAIELLNKADAIIPNSPMALNTRGAIAIEEKQYAEGQKYCEEALVKDPKFFPAQFNLAEIPFQQKDYPGARKVFRQLLSEATKSDVIELLHYRILLTYIMEKDDQSAQTELEKIKFPSTTGAYYYGHAAWEFAHGNQNEAMSWVQSGDWVFSRRKNSYFADVFYDLGWLNRTTAKGPDKKGGASAPAARDGDDQHAKPAAEGASKAAEQAVQPK